MNGYYGDLAPPKIGQAANGRCKMQDASNDYEQNTRSWFMVCLLLSN